MSNLFPGLQTGKSFYSPQPVAKPAGTARIGAFPVAKPAKGTASVGYFRPPTKGEISIGAPTPVSQNSLLTRALNLAMRSPDNIVNFAKEQGISMGKAALQTAAGIVNFQLTGHPTSGMAQGSLPKSVGSFIGRPNAHELAGSAIQTGALLLPGVGGVSKGGSLLSKAVKTGLRQAPSGGAYMGGMAVAENKSPQDIIKSAGTGALLTAGLGTGGSLLGSAISKSIKTKGTTVPVNEIKATPKPSKSTIPAMQNIPVKDVPRLTSDIPKTPSIAKRIFTSTSGVLSNLGNSGKEIANRLQKVESTSELGQAKFLSKIPSVTKLKGDKFKLFVQSLNDLSSATKRGAKAETRKLNQIKRESPEIHQAVTEWSKAIPSIREAAAKTGIEMGDLGKYYFPRNYSELLKTKNGFNQAVQHLVDTKQAKSIPEAIKLLNVIKGKYASPFGHFENSRSKIYIPGYDNSRTALSNYVSGAYNKIGHAEQFGPKGEAAQRLIANIAAEGKDAELASRYYQTAVGTTEQHAVRESVSNGIRTYNRVTKLGLSSILNATQSTNTAALTGFGRTFNAARKALGIMGKEDRAYANKTGTIVDSVINNLREQAGAAAKSKTGLNKLFNAPGFGAVEKFNRGVASIAGRSWADKLAAKGDIKSINILRNKLGVEGKIGPKLTEAQQIQASRKVVEITQFKTGAKDLPAWSQSPEGKMVSQFRTFSYKQTGFVYNELVKEALRGNALPLLRFVAVGVPMGWTASNIRGLLRGQPPSTVKGNQNTPATSYPSQGFDALRNIGIFGLADSGIFVGQNLKSQRLTQYVGSAVGGPTVGLGLQTLQNTSDALQGNTQPIARQGIQQLPVAGPFLANKLLPYNPSGKSQLGNLINQYKDVADAMKNVKYAPGSPSKKQRDKTLTNDQYGSFIKRSSELFIQKAQRAIGSPSYAGLSDEDKKRVLGGQMSDARIQALDELVGPAIKKPSKPIPKY